ncbi:MAG TPA: hypothetical protein VHZ78_03525 [Rhizomicrobium sp.]|nr:hypothetical protein [Rhizomicrobium sp.]
MQRRYLCLALVIALLPSAAAARRHHREDIGGIQIETVIVTGVLRDPPGPFPPEASGIDEATANLDSRMWAQLFAKCAGRYKSIPGVTIGSERVTYSPLWGYVLRVGFATPVFGDSGYVCWKGQTRGTHYHGALFTPAPVARH